MGRFGWFGKKEEPRESDRSKELSSKGLSLIQSGRLDEGIAVLKQAIELDPNNALAHVNLGIACHEKGRTDQAIAELLLAEKLGISHEKIVPIIRLIRNFPRAPGDKPTSKNEHERKDSTRKLEIKKHVDTRPVEAFARYRIGDLIENRFEVIRILPGGMGIVYISIDQKSGWPYAVKTFQDKFLLDEETKRLFVREADTWIRLEKHKNIVKAYWVNVFSGRPYIFLEYVPSSKDGKSNLRDYLLSLNLDKALNFAVQFCDGMIYANNVDLGGGARGIVHRDIKPENIMITPDATVKITDFGLVRAVGFSLERERVAGTPEYMSPEQFEKMDVDMRSDIYSFGVVMYEMLTGKRPFYTDEENERWNYCKQCHQEVLPEPLRQITPTVPAELERIVLKCLEKNPGDRYQSFEALRKALDDAYFKTSGKRVLVQAGPPSEAWELSNRGVSLVGLGRLDEGIAILKQAIQVDPNNKEAYTNLGIAFEGKGWDDQAIIAYTRAIEIDPNYAVAHSNLGDLYNKKGWFDKAITECKRALELDPSNSRTYVALGNAYRRKGLTDQAIMMYKRAASLDPNLSASHVGLGNAYQDKGWIDQAITEYQRAIELDPNDPKVYFNLGMAYYDGGLLDQAIEAYERAVELDPSDARAHTNLGALYGEKGWTDQQIAELKRATELDPNYRFAHFNLAVAYFNSGSFDLAWKHARTAERLGMPTQNIDQLIADLSKVSTEP